MKLAAFEMDGQRRIGLVEGEEIVDISVFAASFRQYFLDHKKITDEIIRIKQNLDRFPLGMVTLKAPVDETSNIFAVGVNYKKHADELSLDVPKHPIIFLKLYSNMIGSGENIMLSPIARQYDYEGELAVVIGRQGYRVARERALDHVAGYTIMNDVTSRDLQWTMLGKNNIVDWFSSKMLEKSAPLGPWITLKDGVDDPHGLSLVTRLNGEVVQDESTALMVFKIPELIEYISSRAALSPGDVISTGTPFGVGNFRQVFLKAGDVVEVEIEKIGKLRNKAADL